MSPEKISSLAKKQKPKVENAAAKPQDTFDSTALSKDLQSQIAEIPFTKQDLLAELENTPSLLPSLRAFLDKYWEKRDAQKLLETYVGLVEKNKKMSSARKRAVLEKLQEVIAQTSAPVLARQNRPQEDNIYQEVSKTLLKGLEKLDQDWGEDSVTRLHSLLLNGQLPLGEIEEDLKTSLSYERRRYPNLTTLYVKTKTRFVLTGRKDLAREFDGFIFAFLQKMNRGFNPKEMADLGEEKVRFQKIAKKVEGTLNDFDRYFRQQEEIPLNMYEETALENIRGLVNKTRSVKEVYSIQAKKLLRLKQRNQLLGLNNVVERYAQKDALKQSLTRLSLSELEIKKQELEEYLEALDFTDSRYIREQRKNLTSQVENYQKRSKRRQTLADYASYELSLVETLLKEKKLEEGNADNRVE